MAFTVRDSRFIGLLLAVTALLFFFRLGNMALTDPDESFYGQTAKEMLDAGEWVTPMIFGEPQFEKPVFFYWLVKSSYLVFGVNEFAARFPSAVFGILGVLGVYFLGRRLYSPLCGFLSGIILATSVEYFALARACVTDMVLLVFILYAFLFFVEGWLTGRKKYFITASAMTALATLTKGPIGLFIPGMSWLLYLIFTKQIKGVFKKVPFFTCAAVFLALSMPWYIAAKLDHGGVFLNEFFGDHNIVRFLHPEHKIGSSPFFYFPVFLGGIFPWTIFFLMGAWEMFRKKAYPGKIKGTHLLLGIWFLVVFVFFSISRTKLVTYIFPLFPAMALMTGRFWESSFKEIASNKRVFARVKISFWIFAVVTAGMGAGALGVTMYKLPEYAAVKGVIISTLIFLGFVVLSLVYILKAKPKLSFAAITLSVLVTTMSVSVYLFPVLDEYHSSKFLAGKINELAEPGDKIGGEDDHRRGLAFYTGVVDIADVHPYNMDLKEFYLREERIWAVVKDVHYQNLKNRLGDRVLEPVARSGRQVLISNR